MASNHGRTRRHTHKKKRTDSDRSPEYMAVKLCDYCGKQCYHTRASAKESARVNHPSQVMHTYSCEERPGITWFHISSIPADHLRQLRDKDFYA